MFCTGWPKLAEKYDMPGLKKIGGRFKYSRLLGDNSWVVPLHCNIEKASDSIFKDPTARLNKD